MIIVETHNLHFNLFFKAGTLIHSFRLINYRKIIAFKKIYQMTGFRGKISKSMSEKLTNSQAHWIAVDNLPPPQVVDIGLEKVLQIASSENLYELPCRKTRSSRIQQLYDTKKEEKEKLLGE